MSGPTESSELALLLAAGKLAVPVEAVYSIADAPVALSAALSGHAGAIVLAPGRTEQGEEWGR
jgi:hypothetical protein